MGDATQDTLALVAKGVKSTIDLSMTALKALENGDINEAEKAVALIHATGYELQSIIEFESKRPNA